MSEAPTLRSRAKANRREALLAAAARLFAERGYNGVSLEELGAAAGVSGPAVYRHFEGKQALLGALLVGVSEHLSSGGQAVVAAAPDDAAALRALVQFHVDFALSNPDVIRVQGQDLGNLADDDRHAVRALQRTYVELWVEVLARLHPNVDTASLRIRAHAAFGLINSTPHSAMLPEPEMRVLLEQMAVRALGLEASTPA
jgi:AcrR family transcriptional regulator